MDGNQRYIDQKLTFYRQDLAILKSKTAEKQEPFASVLSCADSRVPVEIVFDQSIGHVFVNRVAGNLATAETIASIEYGIAVLGTRALMVLGHANCGAVKARSPPRPFRARSARSIATSARPSTRRMATSTPRSGPTRISKPSSSPISSPVVAKAIKDGKLELVAAYYDLASGKVELLD